MKKRAIHVVVLLITTVGLTWLALSLFLLYYAPTLIFLPEFSKDKVIPQDYKQLYLVNTNQERLDTLWIENRESPDVILYFHGNAGRQMAIFPHLAYKANVLSPSYPGYGSSEGMPSYDNVYETAEIALKYLHKKGFTNEHIIVYGHSMGSSPALYLAAKHQGFKQIVLVNAYSSIHSMCQRQYYVFCVFGGDIFNNAKLAKEVKSPVRQYHVYSSTVVPYSEGEELFKHFGNIDKQFTKLEGDHAEFDMQVTLDF